VERAFTTEFLPRD